jgi:predicted nucleic acid-binding protein
MSEVVLLDTNILLRHILADPPDHTPRATAYLQRIEQGDAQARLTDTVIFETVYVLQSLHRVPRPDIRDAILTILRLSHIRLSSKRMLREVFDLYVSTPSLSYADCYHAVLTKRLGLAAIVTFDRKFDRVPGLVRVEPA